MSSLDFAVEVEFESLVEGQEFTTTWSLSDGKIEVEYSRNDILYEGTYPVPKNEFKKLADLTDRLGFMALRTQPNRTDNRSYVEITVHKDFTTNIIHADYPPTKNSSREITVFMINFMGLVYQYTSREKFAPQLEKIKKIYDL